MCRPIYTYALPFGSCDLDLDPMTLMYEHTIDILIKVTFLAQDRYNFEHTTSTQTHRQKDATERITSRNR